ncbi:Fe(2+) transporter [Imshaugia aleurites]|uniref:Fe(2+) transporter n=1 Tax=Imshaugia aleurites TaxID=172621 RepID=A0A8H3ENJ0_9LECA|nr:Fe(2+) transporter [Imshaugia aleurites]
MPWEGIDQAIIHSQGVKMHKSQDILEKGLHRVAVSGACATIASDALMNPFDVIKQRMQVHGSMYRSIRQCTKSVYKNEGLRAFYISYPTTISMTVPFTALQFSAYGSISQYLNPSRDYNPTTHMVAGGLAGGLAAALTTPLDVIKTLLQTRGTAKDIELRHAKGMFNAAAIIKRQHGYGGFFRGLQPRILTTVPSTAICWSSYELAKNYFIRHNDEL